MPSMVTKLSEENKLLEENVLQYEKKEDIKWNTNVSMNVLIILEITNLLLMMLSTTIHVRQEATTH